MASVMIRVDEAVRDAAAALAKQTGSTIADVVAGAVERARVEAFWDSVDAAYDRLTPEELADERAETERMAASLKDGLDDW